MQRWALVIALLLASSPGFGCSDDESSAHTAESDYRVHRRLWASRAPEAYIFRLERQCECPPEAFGPIDIQVESGQVRTLWRDPGHQPVDLDLGLSIEDLFGRIRQALDAGYETVDVRYNPRLGYPERLYLDKAGIVDEEFGATAVLLCLETATDIDSTCLTPIPPTWRRYRFTARDSLGVAIVAGTLGLAIGDPADPSSVKGITGERCLRGLCGVSVPETFLGEYKVAGEIDRFGGVMLNLNADWVDLNIFLTGRFSGLWSEYGDFSGAWVHSTFVGARARGTFTAELLPAR